MRESPLHKTLEKWYNLYRRYSWEQYKLTTEHINSHIERLDKMRKYANLHGDKRSFLGAAAGVVMTPDVKDYALKQGFFVIEPSGETFNITQPIKPKQW